MKGHGLLAILCLASSFVSTGVRADEPIRIPYGTEPTSFGELRLPAGKAGKIPVAVLVHGGCWRADRGTVESFRPMAEALATDGIATWNIEFRRVGHDGGGWPGTFLDLGKAVDLLPTIARRYALDLHRIVLVGHSSGGHFAGWLAARKRLPKGSAIRGKPAVEFAAVLLSDAFLDPRVIDSKGVDGKLYCGEPTLGPLVGGSPDTHPENLEQISPLEWLPWKVPQRYVVSSLRYPVTPGRALAGGRTTMVMPDYPALARAAGDRVDVDIVDEADHFDFMRPGTKAYDALHRGIVAMFAP